jgi:pSer/pThr/pTyr-binding forkhead associated (FHA) protein
VINCSKCGKDNQDHYKFCLGCGAELTRAAEAKAFSPGTPPHGMKSMSDAGAATALAVDPGMGATPPRSAGQAAPAAYPVAYPAATPGASATPSPSVPSVDCPQCSHRNPQTNRFCASCGYNLSALQAALPTYAAPTSHAGGDSSIVLTALRADGTEAGSFPLPEGPHVVVGRDTGSIFAGDSYLSPRHASFTRAGGQLIVRDENSLNGIYLRLQPDVPCRLDYGSVFRIGQEIVRFDALEPAPPSADGVERLGSPSNGFVGRLALVIGRDTTGNAFPVPHTGLHCGRERGDVLFSEDGYVSGLHCRIAPGPDGAVYLTDVGSSNGTFIRLNAEHALTPGDILLMGQQLFRVDM